MAQSTGVKTRQANQAESEQFNGANLIVEINADTALTEATANTAQVLNLFDVRDGHLVEYKGGYLKTPFEDASDAAFNSNTITLGDGGDADRFLVSTQLNVNGTEILYPLPALGAYAYTATDTVDATIGSMTAKSLSEIDTGVILLGFRVSDLKLYGPKEFV